MAYGMILTSIGAAKLLAAATDDDKLVFSKFVWGDANGTPYTPSGSETALVHQIAETDVVSTEVVEDTPNVYKVVGSISSAPTEFILREVGILDGDGDLIAIGNHGELTVPAATGGSFELNYSPSYLLVISPDLAVAVTLTPASDYATEEWVTANFQPLGTYVKTVTGSDGITVTGSATDRAVKADKSWFDERYKAIDDDAPGVESVTAGNDYIAITGTASDPKVGAALAKFDARYRGINDPFPLQAHRHDNATESSDGFMSKEDKTFLDGLSSGLGTGFLTKVAETVISSARDYVDVLNISGAKIYIVRFASLRVTPDLDNSEFLPVWLQTGNNSTLYTSVSDYRKYNSSGGAITNDQPYFYPGPSPVGQGWLLYGRGSGKVQQGDPFILKYLNSASKQTAIPRFNTPFNIFGLMGVDEDTDAGQLDYAIRSAATAENRIRILTTSGYQFTSGRISVYSVGA
jgi:hypothetical protein